MPLEFQIRRSRPNHTLLTPEQTNHPPHSRWLGVAFHVYVQYLLHVAELRKSMSSNDRQSMELDKRLTVRDILCLDYRDNVICLQSWTNWVKLHVVRLKEMTDWQCLTLHTYTCLNICCTWMSSSKTECSYRTCSNVNKHSQTSHTKQLQHNDHATWWSIPSYPDHHQQDYSLCLIPYHWEIPTSNHESNIQLVFFFKFCTTNAPKKYR